MVEGGVGREQELLEAPSTTLSSSVQNVHGIVSLPIPRDVRYPEN